MTKVVLEDQLDNLKQWAKKPLGFDYSGYAPIRVQCKRCATIQTCSRSQAENSHSYYCLACGHLDDVPFVCPDPAQVFSKGPLVITLYCN